MEDFVFALDDYLRTWGYSYSALVESMGPVKGVEAKTVGRELQSSHLLFERGRFLLFDREAFLRYCAEIREGLDQEVANCRYLYQGLSAEDEASRRGGLRRGDPPSANHLG